MELIRSSGKVIFTWNWKRIYCTIPSIVLGRTYLTRNHHKLFRVNEIHFLNFVSLKYRRQIQFQKYDKFHFWVKQYKYLLYKTDISSFYSSSIMSWKRRTAFYTNNIPGETSFKLPSFLPLPFSWSIIVMSKVYFVDQTLWRIGIERSQMSCSNNWTLQFDIGSMPKQKEKKLFLDSFLKEGQQCSIVYGVCTMIRQIAATPFWTLYQAPLKPAGSHRKIIMQFVLSWYIQ